MSPTESNNELNHESGLVVVASSQYMRDILNQNYIDKSNGILVIKIHYYRIKKYNSAYLARLATRCDYFHR